MGYFSAWYLAFIAGAAPIGLSGPDARRGVAKPWVLPLEGVPEGEVIYVRFEYRARAKDDPKWNGVQRQVRCLVMRNQVRVMAKLGDDDPRGTPPFGPGVSQRFSRQTGKMIGGLDPERGWRTISASPLA